MSFPSTTEVLDLSVIMRNNLMAFADRTFYELYPEAEFVRSKHLALIAAKLEQCEAGLCRRLIISLPPRSLKSILASVALPAWALGRNPHRQIICASYGQDLADKHARDTRAIMMSSWYQKVFPARLLQEKRAVNDFMTTAGGFRMATSVGGVLTGRGADLLIVDDPLKPTDAYSESSRTAVNRWFDQTLLSRLNNKQQGVIVIVMQRLHQDDLVGHLLEREAWDELRLAAIAEEDENFECKGRLFPVRFQRKAGCVLDDRRESLQTVEEMRRSLGTYAFEAQYQQKPQPEGGAIIKTDWLRFYTPMELPSHFSDKIQSWDTANKSGDTNDYSVCTTWGVLDKRNYVLDVYRKRLEHPDLVRAAMEQYEKHSPRRIVIEDKGSGTPLLQHLKREGIPVTPYTPQPGNDKTMRLIAQSAVFESGLVLLPASAPWLAEYTRELTGFPGTKHDDQVDSTTQALDHITKTPRYRSSIQELLL